MKAKHEVTLFEFDYIAAEGTEKHGSVSSNIEIVSNSTYAYLKQLCLCDESESQLLQLRRRDGMEVLQVQNYVGVVFTPDKTQIEILPKVGKNFGTNGSGSTDESEKARQSLLIMLKALKGFAHIQTSSANIAHQKMPLLEVFISQFLNSVNELVKRGLRSDYVPQEDNLGFLKGKLNVGKQVRLNFINKHKFFCEYDEFMLDRPANRLIHTALLKVKNFARSSANQKLLQELLFVFHEIPKSRDHKLDFTKLKLDRGMSHYHIPLEWCRLILNGFSPQTMKGSTNAASLLFPMEKVFEDYVAKVLKEQLARKRPELTLSTQATGQYLATYDSRGKFSLRPDLLIQHGSINKIVLDTKWKLLDSSVTYSNISQSDVYQMFAYAKKYLKPSAKDLSVGKDVVLIYPWQNNFDAPLEYYYDLDDGHRLWIVPFKICERQSHVIWPDKAKTILELPK
ncbi:McrC family protein [Vibrio maerlii]|uniref:McrC family protein n=1 Tax=Vibrio maerlii TaxID=2231648 RepID=UPI000E3C22DA|nr:McrC family protein [Vibrio maerlii]